MTPYSLVEIHTSVGVPPKLLTERRRNRGSITNICKKFFLSGKHPYRLWDPVSLSSVISGCPLARGKWTTA